MGVLDSFVFLLETDNRNALKGINEAGNALDDVEDGSNQAHKALLGMFVGVGEKAGLTAASLKDVAIGALGIAGAGFSLNAVLDHTAEMLQKVRDAKTVGVGIEQYDALSRTFLTLGVDADGFRDSMIDLNEALGEAVSDAKSGKAESFKTFGVSLKDAQGNIKSADQALLDLADSMSKMDKQQATFQIKQLGITDNAMISAMLGGRKELERQIQFQKELGVTTEKDAEQLEKFARAQKELSAIFSRFADILSMTAVPALDLFIDTTIAVIKWGREHKGFLIGFFGALAGVAIPMLTSALWGMATAAWAAIAPFIPFIAAAVVLGLVIDDLWTYFNGGESVIGDLVQRFPVLGEVLENVKESFLSAWEALKLLFSDPSAFMDVLVSELQASWDEIVSGVVNAGNAIGEAIGKAWTKLTDDTKKVFTDLLSWVMGLFSQLGDYVSKAVSGAAKAAYNGLPDFVKKGINMVTGGGDEQSGEAEHNPMKQSSPTEQAANVVNAAASAPIIPPASVVNNSAPVQQTTQKIEKIEVNVASGDPQQIRTAVSDGMNDSVQQMANQYDDARSH
ncbi:TPA: phage tail tape measure protein [Escherichia coli]|nr:phage tail tape measure protein [Escherichia coli]